jgi:hypothetical protein
MSSGLDVSDQNLRISFKLIEFLEQHLGTKMTAEFRHRTIGIAERRLDDEMPQIPDLIYGLPQGVTACGVSTKH